MDPMSNAPAGALTSMDGWGSVVAAASPPAKRERDDDAADPNRDDARDGDDEARPEREASDRAPAADAPAAKKPKPDATDAPPDVPMDDDDEAGDVKLFAARLRPGTLKHTCFVLLQRALGEGLETNEILEKATAEDLYVGKNRNVLTTTLSHEPWFVHRPDDKTRWCLRSFVEGGPEAAAAATAAVAGSDPNAPKRKPPAPKPPKDPAEVEARAQAKVAAAAAKAKAVTEKAQLRSLELAEKAQLKAESQLALSLTKGTAEKIKRAQKAVEQEEAKLEKMRAARDAAEAKAVKAGVSPSDFEKMIAAEMKKASGKGGKGKGGGGGGGGTPTKGKPGPGQGGPGKSAAEILREPNAPTGELPPRLQVFNGDSSDRHALMKWKKEVEKFKDGVDRAKDAYVAKRRKALKAEAAKEGAATAKLVADAVKHFNAFNDAEAGLLRAKKILLETNERGVELEMILKERAELGKGAQTPESARRMAEIDIKLALIDGKKVTEFKAQGEKEIAKEKAKIERLAKMQAEKAERDRIKEEEKAQRAAAREAERLEREKKKEDERLAKERAMKYPIDDDLLRAEFEEEAAKKNVSVDELYPPLPTPKPVEHGVEMADEAALTDFLHVFGETLGAPLRGGDSHKDRVTVKKVKDLIVACGEDLESLYNVLLDGAMEIAVIGKGRNAAKWRRVLGDATWPEVVRRVLEKKHAGGHGVAALGKKAWANLSVHEHVLALRGLSDLALGSEAVRSIIDWRLEEAAKLRTARIEERNADAARRRAIENKAKEKRIAIREKAAAKRKAEREAKRLAREAALAAGKEVDPEEEEDEDEENNDDDDDGDVDMADADDDDVKQEEPEVKEEKPKPKLTFVIKKQEPRAPSPEPCFDLPKHLIEYEGHPDDRKALMAWRAEHNRVAEKLANDRREYEKRKRSELRKEQEKERMERQRIEDEEAAKIAEEEAKEKAKERELRKKETTRMAEDAAVAVRVHKLGVDRDHRSYWWGIGGSKAAVYVEDIQGHWFVLDTRDEIDDLVEALHSWGTKEKKLKAELARRSHTIAAEFRKQAREREDAEADSARRAASGYSQRERGKEVISPPPGRGPNASFDEAVPVATAKRTMEVLCGAAEEAAIAREPELETKLREDWRAFKTRVRTTYDKDLVAGLLLQLEENLYAIQKAEFMKKEEREAREEAKANGETYESESSDGEDFYDDDDEFWGNEEAHETNEDLIARTGLIYPIWRSKAERAKWREDAHEFQTGAAVAFAAAVLDDTAGAFLRAVVAAKTNP